MKNSLEKTREIKVLISQLRVFCKTVDEVLNNANAAETARYASYADMARTYNDFAYRVKEVLNVSTMFYTFNLDTIPSWGDTVWPTQKRILEQVLLSVQQSMAALQAEESPASRELIK